MKYIKLYEDFINDENRGQEAAAEYDHSNSPVIREEARKYVQSILYSNEYKLIFDELGLEAPKEVEGQQMNSMFDEIEEKAIDYYVKHPERMSIELDTEVNKMAVTGGNNQTGNDLTSRVPVITHT